MVWIADPLGAWLIERLADAAVKKLTMLALGTDQKRALQSAGKAAVRRTAEELYPGDVEQADWAAQDISQAFRVPAPGVPSKARATLLEMLQAEIAGQLELLDNRLLTSTGDSLANPLQGPAESLTERLTRNLIAEIKARATGGGPLAALADQLNHDETHRRAQRVEDLLGQLLVRTSDDTAVRQLGQALRQLSSLSEGKRLGGIAVLDHLVGKARAAGDLATCQIVLSRLAVFVREYSHHPWADDRPLPYDVPRAPEAPSLRPSTRPRGQPPLPDVVAAIAVISRGPADPAGPIDLEGANLALALLNGMQLAGVDLYQADLTGAELRGTDLSGARLVGTVFNLASMEGATLAGCNLTYAVLTDAALDGADLKGATLWEADLRYARLVNVELSGADLSRADLRDAKLQGLGETRDINFTDARVELRNWVPEGWRKYRVAGTEEIRLQQVHPHNP